MDVVIGMDLSLNGPAFVALSLKRRMVLKWGFVTTTQKHVKCTDVEGGYRYLLTKKGKNETSDAFEARRRHFITRCVMGFVSDCYLLYSGEEDRVYTTVAIEGYAYGSAGNRKTAAILQLGELAGTIKNTLFHNNIAYRIYAPGLVKTWATDNPHAKKFEMVRKAVEYNFVELAAFLEKGSKFKPPLFMDGDEITHDLKGPGVDLADAFHIASMLREEMLLKREWIDMSRVRRSDLFYSTTKTRTTPLVDQPFIYRGGEK